MFAKVFITLVPGVVSRNDEAAATAINTWLVVNVSRAPGLCLFNRVISVSFFVPFPPVFLVLFVRKFLSKTDTTEATEDPFIVATGAIV